MGEVGWIEVIGLLIPRSTHTDTHKHTHHAPAHPNANEKSEIKNAVMKCGPEKGRWVVVRKFERERERLRQRVNYER